MTRSLLAVAVGYLLGTFPSADAAGVLAGVSVRHSGTGNPGATNAAVLLGRRWGVAVGAIDVAKGALAGWLGQRVGPSTAHLSAAAAVVGHVFPVWSRGRGGKGVATSYGAVLGAFPVYAAPDLAVGLLAARWAPSPGAATNVASLAYVGAALCWWHRRLPTLWGPLPTAALPLSATAVSTLIAWRFRQADRVTGGVRWGDRPLPTAATPA